MINNRVVGTRYWDNILGQLTQHTTPIAKFRISFDTNLQSGIDREPD